MSSTRHNQTVAHNTVKVQPGKVASLVSEWINDDIGYNPRRVHTDEERNKAPSTTQIKEICRHDMLSVWDYLISNVHNSKNVDHMKKNLQINGKTIHDQIQKQREARNELIQRRQDVKARIQQIREELLPKLEHQIDQARTNLINDQQENNVQVDSFDFADKQAYILKAYEKKCRYNNFILEGYNNQVLKEIQLFSQKQDVQQRVQDILNEYNKVNTAKDLVPIDLTSNAPLLLKSIISIKKSKVEEGRRDAYSTENEVKHPKLSTLLHRMAQEHIDNFIETEKLLNESNKMEKQLDKLKNFWHERDGSIFSTVQLDQLYELIDKEMIFVADCAARNILESHNQEVTTLIEELKKYRDGLSSRFSTKSELEKQIKQKETVYEGMCHTHSQIHNDMTSLIHGSAQVVENHIKPFKDSLVLKVGSTKNLFYKELKLFEDQPLVCSYVDEQNIRHKDKHMLVNASQPKNEKFSCFREVASELNHALYKTPESLYDKVHQITRDTLSIESSEMRLKNALDSSVRINANLDQGPEVVADIVNNCDKLDTEKHQVWLPVCKEILSECQITDHESEMVLLLKEESFSVPANNIDWTLLNKNV
ncbi:hypothetical protein AKO1_009019 [Acrasis kona]|uniref:Uncharacterized protein n=1 Tax=Acrasis kona TaxID=1008807 RepID=A0AAW2ZH11_9EUKA